MFKLDLEKAEEPEIKLPTSVGSSKKQESSRKTSTSALLTINKLWKILQEMGILDHLTCLLRNLNAGQEATVKIPDMEQRTGSKLGKECIKVVYCHSAYLIYMQNISCEMLACMKHKLQDCWEKYQQLQICRWHHFMAECEEELKKLLMKVKEENQNVALKLNIEKN